MFRSGRWDQASEDPVEVSGFLKIHEGVWQAYDIQFGASEAWWSGSCQELERLMPETCGGTLQNDTENETSGEAAKIGTSDIADEVGLDTLSAGNIRAAVSAIVGDLLAAYKGDLGRMAQVADNADYVIIRDGTLNLCRFRWVNTDTRRLRA